MSLQLALDQIQRPIWWHEGENDYPYQRHGKVSGSVKQAAVLSAIRSERRPNAAALTKVTGYTVQSIRYWTYFLVDAGKIRRIEASGNRVYWEAVK